MPEDLIFNINYLGGLMPNYSLNFSKGSNTIIAQYYNFIRLGMKGYKDIMSNMLENARFLASKLERTGKFEILNKLVLFPLIAVKLKNCEFNEFDLSEHLRQKGWIVPAYTLPANADDITVLRMVIKESFGKDMVEMLFKDIMDSIETLNQSFDERRKIFDEKDNPTLLY